MSKKITFKSHPLMIVSELGTGFYLILISIITNFDNVKNAYFSIKEGNFSFSFFSRHLLYSRCFFTFSRYYYLFFLAQMVSH